MQSTEYASFSLMFEDTCCDTAVMPQDKQYIKQILENLNFSEKIAHENDQHFQNRNKQ